MLSYFDTAIHIRQSIRFLHSIMRLYSNIQNRQSLIGHAKFPHLSRSEKPTFDSSETKLRRETGLTVNR